MTIFDLYKFAGQLICHAIIRLIHQRENDGDKQYQTVSKYFENEIHQNNENMQLKLNLSVDQQIVKNLWTVEKICVLKGLNIR